MNFIRDPGEEWKDIPGYEGLYKVSDKGRVLSVRRNKLKKPTLSSNGYLHVNLCVNNQAKGFNVHRLVAIAFLDNPDNLTDVNHEDGNKHNNNLSNLNWCSRTENHRHAWRTGLRYRGSGSKLTDDQVREIRNKYNDGGVSYRKLASEYGITYGAAYSAINRKTYKNIL